MDILDILRYLGEKKLSCPKDEELLPLHKRLKNKVKYFKLRKKIANRILGKSRFGGVLMQVDLAYKTKEEVNAFWDAIKLLRKAGISFDTGMGCKFDMELDWSLKGATVYCKRCGYDSEENRIILDNYRQKHRFYTPCQKCYELIDSDDGYWREKSHWWSRTKYYHQKCHDSPCTCSNGGCNRCQALG